MSRSTPNEMPQELYGYVKQVISDDVLFLQGSTGTIQQAGSEAYKKSLEQGEEAAVEAAIAAIDAKVEFLYERSRKRWEPSLLTKAQQAELHRRKPGRPAFFRGLRT